MAEVADQAVGHIDRGAARRRAARGPAPRAARDAPARARSCANSAASRREPAQPVRERQRGVAQRARDPDRIAGLAPLRRSASPAGTSPRMVTQRLSGPRVVSPPTRSTPCAIGQREEAPRERAEPAASADRQRPGQQRPARRRAHRRHVGQVDRERLVAERFGFGAGEKMAALDQHVDRRPRSRSPGLARAAPHRRRRRAPRGAPGAGRTAR